jgi:hypothetical protein
MLKIFSLLLLIILLLVINFKDTSIINDNKLINNNLNTNKHNKHNKHTKQLEEICKKMTNDTYIKLKTIKKSCKYIRATIPFKIRFEINFIVNTILIHINKLFHFKTYFIEVEHLEVYEDTIGNKQYIANVLVNNITSAAGIKLKIDVIAYIKNKAKLNNYLTKFKIGSPSNDQLIPIPMDVLVSERGVISTDSISETRPDKFSHLYINYIQILNANCIINGDHIEDKEILKTIQDNMGGVNTTRNEFSFLPEGKSDPYIEQAVTRNKWPTLKEQPINCKQWPCTPALLTWNELGVPFNQLHYGTDCPGKRESTVQTELQPQHYPTLGPLPRDKGQNTWLFDKARGITSFPTGRGMA